MFQYFFQTLALYRQSHVSMIHVGSNNLILCELIPIGMLKLAKLFRTDMPMSSRCIIHVNCVFVAFLPMEVMNCTLNKQIA